MYKLVCLAGINLGQEFPITGKKFTIGRQAENNLRIVSPFVSKIHAEIECDESGTYWIHDLGSKNGTFVDDQQISQKFALREGCKLIVGRSDIFMVARLEEILNEVPVSDLADNLENLPGHDSNNVKDEGVNPLESDTNDSWVKLMGLSNELEKIFTIAEPGKKAGDSGKPDLKDPSLEKTRIPDDQRLDPEIFSQVLLAAKIVINTIVKNSLFDNLYRIFDQVATFQTGVLVLNDKSEPPDFWKPYYLNQPEPALLKDALAIHQNQISTQKGLLLPGEGGKDSILYFAFENSIQTIGFIILKSVLEKRGFSMSERAGFEYVCQLITEVLLNNYPDSD